MPKWSAIVEGTEPLQQCPACNHPRAYYEVVVQDILAL